MLEMWLKYNIHPSLCWGEKGQGSFDTQAGKMLEM